MSAAGARLRAWLAAALGRGAGDDATAGGAAGAGSAARAARGVELDFEGAVASLAGERERFAAVLEALGEGVLATGPGEIVSVANAAARRLLGLRAAAVGRPLVDAVRVPELVSLVRDAAAGNAREVEVSLDRPRPSVVVATAAPLGKGEGAVLTLRDVTELRRLEAVRRDFVANVSHEIRTPVSVIRASTEALQTGAADDPEARQRFLDAIHRHADRLSSLVSDLLDLSRIESGSLELELRPLPVAEAVASALESLGDALRGREVTTDVPGELRARADAGALEQVLVNFLENAGRHTPPGTPVGIRAREEDGAVRIEVADLGTGLSEADRRRVFERFYRVDPGRARAAGGTGLGLAIVKHLAVSMGGEVGVEPGPERGSVFWIRLPRADSGA